METGKKENARRETQREFLPLNFFFYVISSILFKEGALRYCSSSHLIIVIAKSE